MADVIEFLRPPPKAAELPDVVQALDPALRNATPVYIVFVPCFPEAVAWQGKFFRNKVEAAAEVSTATWRSWEALEREGWRIVPSVIMPLEGPSKGNGGRVA